jgi:hypothetical protein
MIFSLIVKSTSKRLPHEIHHIETLRLIGGKCVPRFTGQQQAASTKVFPRTMMTLSHHDRRLCRKVFFSTHHGKDNKDGLKVHIENYSKQDNHVKNDDEYDVTKCNTSDTKEETPSEETSNQNPKLKKNDQQVAEEEIYMLQSHVKQHFQHANYTAALSTAKDILEKSTSLFGRKHPATASAYNNIGLMHKMMGDFDVSRENYHSALLIYQEVVGKDHESYAATLNNLGNLDRYQSTIDENLTSLQRMQFNDSAVEYFEEAWNIRKAELGEEHVYTVTSRSNLGGALAAQVLQSEVFRQKRLQEERDKEQQNNSDVESGDVQKNTKDLTRTVSKYTKQKWEIAEEHLRAAFRTAVNNPRGEKVPAQSKSSDSSSTLKRRDKTLSKKEKQKAAKLRKWQDKSNKSTVENTVNNDLGPGDISICTLSSAAAAQNLAVFLKSRADLILKSNDFDSSLVSDDMYAEAKGLYLGAFRVRFALKGANHPDTVATKFSLAELLEVIGDEDGANKLRQELLDSYDVEELETEDTTSM